MGRKCSTLFDGLSCDSGYKNSTYEGRIFSFPPPGLECERWLNALPNYIDINTISKWMGVCEKHWEPGYEYKFVQGGRIKPIHPPTEFDTTPTSFRRQYVEPSHSRDVQSRNVLSEERSWVSDAKEKAKDKIISWES